MMISKQNSFTRIVDKLFEFWSSRGSIKLFGSDFPIGAGTWHPEVVKSSLLKDSYNIAFVQPSRRPKDGRGVQSNNRLYTHHQFQLLICPPPANIQQLIIQSLKACGVDLAINSVDFITSEWESPSMGAFGLGYELQCNRSEIGQVTYFQEILDTKLKVQPIEVAYGLERIAAIVQDVESFFDLIWNENENYSYGEIRGAYEKEICQQYDPSYLSDLLNKYEMLCYSCSSFYPAYENFAAMSHNLNMLESQGIKYTERHELFNRVRKAGRFCKKLLLENSLINEGQKL